MAANKTIAPQQQEVANEITFADVLKKLAAKPVDKRSKSTRIELLAQSLWDAALGSGDDKQSAAWAQRLVIELLHGKPAQAASATDDNTGTKLRALDTVREASKWDINTFTVDVVKRADKSVGGTDPIFGGPDKGGTDEGADSH